jgi:class 3 adenylate cyclase
VAIGFGGVVAGIWASVLAFFVIELGLQPVMWDVAVRRPKVGPPPVYRASIGRHLFGAMVGIGLITSCGAAVLAAPHGSQTKLAEGMAASLLITTIVSAALTMLVVGTTAAPIRHLFDVTQRVRAGDLSVRSRPFSTNEVGQLAESLNAMLDGLRDRAVLHQAFGSYVDPHIADRILEEGTVLRGTSWDATIVFVDIRGFTEWSERVSPDEAVERLDAFFAVVIPVIERHGGTVNKFVGDGLVAVFGHPGSLPGVADNAVRAVVELVATVDERFGSDLSVGVGINSGPIVAGTVGGGGRFEYMLIGDAVNVASRVERLTRATGDIVLLTEATLARLEELPSGLERRGEIRVKGKREPLRIFALGRVV